MISQKTYDIYQQMAHLIIDRAYKPAEFKMFHEVTNYIGPKMKEYEEHEKVKASSSSGSKSKNKGKKSNKR